MARESESRLVLNTIRAVVDHAAMQDFYAEKGGTEVWIPRFPDADHWMSRLFGEEKAIEITRRLNVIDADGKIIGNLRCYVPSLNGRYTKLMLEIEHEVREALFSGKAIRDICRDVGVSERRVHRHLKLLRQSGELSPHNGAKGLRARQTQIMSREASDLSAQKQRLETEVNDALLKGCSNRFTATLVGESITFVRQRRMAHVAAGKLGPEHRCPTEDSSKRGRGADDPAPPTGEVAP